MTIYFGSYTGGASAGPIKWYVVENDGTTATLWTTTSMGKRKYNSTADHHNWSGSDICAWLNGTGSYTATGFLPMAFDDAEQDAIATYGTTEDTNGHSGIIISQKIVLPSVAEIGNATATGTWGITQTTRGLGDNWWLRSPGGDNSNAAFVSNDGHVSSAGSDVYYEYFVCPAFKLNLSSVLFTSDASGASGKSAATAGGGLVGAAATAGAIKLTVQDDAHLSLTYADTTARTVKAGDTVDITYSGAATGTNRYVSCVIENSGGVLFYGKLINCASDNASGTASFTVPAAADLPDGSYTIKLFSEEANDDYYLKLRR
jgi:hypothetical protein